MSMARRVPTPSSPLTGWLEAVQRDPRTMGAFRQRIETLLRDPTLARRVAGRLEHRRELGLAEPLGLREEATPDNGLPDNGLRDNGLRDNGLPDSRLRDNRLRDSRVQGTTRALIGAFLCDEAGAVSIFGRCECRGGPCRLMRQDEAHMPGRLPPELRDPPRAPGMLRH